MESHSQTLTTPPPSDWTGLTHTLEQRHGAHAAAAYTHDCSATGNHANRSCSYAPTLVLGHGSARNDAACKYSAAIPEDDVKVWTEHAVAANGSGESAVAEAAPSALPTSYDVHQAARACRSLALGELIIAAIKAVRAFAR